MSNELLTSSIVYVLVLLIKQRVVMFAELPEQSESLLVYIFLLLNKQLSVCSLLQCACSPAYQYHHCISEE